MSLAAAHRPVRRGRSSWWRPFVGSAAPIAAFMATKGGGRTGPAPPSAAKRPKQSGGWREPAILFRDVKRPKDATENSRRTPLRGRTACRRVALSRRPWARSSQARGGLQDRRRSVRPVYRLRLPFRSKRSYSRTESRLEGRTGVAKLHAAWRHRSYADPR